MRYRYQLHSFFSLGTCVIRIYCVCVTHCACYTFHNIMYTVFGFFFPSELEMTIDIFYLILPLGFLGYLLIVFQFLFKLYSFQIFDSFPSGYFRVRLYFKKTNVQLNLSILRYANICLIYAQIGRFQKILVDTVLIV